MPSLAPSFVFPRCAVFHDLFRLDGRSGTVELRYRSLVQNCARVTGKPEVNWRNQAITPLTARLGGDVSHREDDCVSNPHRHFKDARANVLAEECRPAWRDSGVIDRLPSTPLGRRGDLASYWAMIFRPSGAPKADTSPTTVMKLASGPGEARLDHYASSLAILPDAVSAG